MQEFNELVKLTGETKDDIVSSMCNTLKAYGCSKVRVDDVYMSAGKEIGMRFTVEASMPYETIIRLGGLDCSPEEIKEDWVDTLNEMISEEGT